MSRRGCGVWVLVAALAMGCGSDDDSAGTGGSGGGTSGAGGSSDGGTTSAGGAGTTGSAGAGTAGSGAPGTGGSGGTGGPGGTGALGGGAGTAGEPGAGTGGSGGSAGAAASAGSCGDGWLITYEVTGVFSVTETTAGMGDAANPIGPGELTLRFMDDGGAPGDGAVHLISYTMPLVFTVTPTIGPSVDTGVMHSAGTGECGVASGSLAGDVVTWDRCTYSATHGVDPNSWTPDDTAEGPGCVTDYHSAGTVTCNGSDFMCGMGNLSAGENQESETWDQPLNSLELSGDLGSFTMRGLDGPSGSGDMGVEVPNRAPSRAYFNLDGTETGRSLEPTPACLCP